jgi:2-dehydropantoate 2-reductase
MGAGAIGCWIGGTLRAAGLEVVLIGRERLEREIRTSGLTISDLDGKTTALPAEQVSVTLDPKAVADSDVVLVATKSAETAQAGHELAKVMRADAIAVSLQNGLRNAKTLRAALGGRQVLAGIVGFNVVGKGDARFHRATTGPLVIEHSADPWILALASSLESRGLEVKLVRDIEPLQWSKLIINLNNAVSALSDQPTRSILLSPGYRRVLAATIREALAVLHKAGIRPARIGPLPTWSFPWLLGLPTFVFRAVARAELKVDPEARSSMWDDLVRGRRTEVDQLNGEIVELGKQHGVDAAMNRRIVELVHEFEARKSGSPKLSAERLWRALTTISGC